MRTAPHSRPCARSPRATGPAPNLLAKLTKLDLLAIDDWLLAPLTDAERRDLLEVLEDRSEHTSTLISSQLPRTARRGDIWTIGGIRGFPRLTERPLCAPASLFPQVIVEVLIYDEDGRFVLKHRKDEHFVGWHVPGGRSRVLESIEDACNRHVRLDEVAAGVTDVKVIGVHVQEKGEHPYGFPVCLFTAAKAVGPVIEKADCKWFSETPRDLIPPPQKHDRYIEVFQQWFRSDRKGFAITF